MAVAALPPAPILIYADEYWFNGSRKAGPSGLWRIHLKNLGEDEHDIRVQDNRTKRVIKRSRLLLPTQHGSIMVRLKPGTYTLFCGVPYHRALGMHWKLIVRTPKVRRTAP